MCNEQSIYDAIATVNFYSKGQHLDSVNIQGLCEPPIQMSTRTEDLGATKTGLVSLSHLFR